MNPWKVFGLLALLPLAALFPRIFPQAWEAIGLGTWSVFILDSLMLPVPAMVMAGWQSRLGNSFRRQWQLQIVPWYRGSGLASPLLSIFWILILVLFREKHFPTSRWGESIGCFYSLLLCISAAKLISKEQRRQVEFSERRGLNSKTTGHT